MAWEGWSRRSLSLLLIVSLAFNIGVGLTFGVMAYHRGALPGFGKRHEGRQGKLDLAKELQLDPDQAALLEQSRNEMYERVSGVRQQLKAAGERLTDLMTAPEPDRQAIAAQLDETARLRRQMSNEIVQHFLDSRKLLRPEQHEVFDEMIRRAFRHGGPERGGLKALHGPRGRVGRGKTGEHRGPKDWIEPQPVREKE